MAAASGSRSGRPHVVHERSAGGIALIPIGRSFLVPAIVPRGSRALALPKGHAEPGESPGAAAEREVLEETGVRGHVIAELATIEYWFHSRQAAARVHKLVDFFLLRYGAGRPGRHDDEVERVVLVELSELPSRLTHSGERQAAARALEAVGAGYVAGAANDWRVGPA